MRVFVVMISIFLIGCSSSPKLPVTPVPVKEPVEVEMSQSTTRPAWTTKTVYESGGQICFVGAFMDGSDYAFTVRLANAEALKVAVQSISQFIRAEFSSYIQGDNSTSIDRYASDGIATFSKNVHVQGIKQVEVYFKKERMGRVTYSVFVRLEMSRVDYVTAKAEVLRQLRDRFAREGRIEAKQKAQQLLDKLLKEV